MDIEDTLDNPAFWILGGGAVAMEILGWTIGRKAGWASFSFIELLILIIGTLIIAAFFANRD